MDKRELAKDYGQRGEIIHNMIVSMLGRKHVAEEILTFVKLQCSSIRYVLEGALKFKDISYSDNLGDMLNLCSDNLPGMYMAKSVMKRIRCYERISSNEVLKEGLQKGDVEFLISITRTLIEALYQLITPDNSIGSATLDTEEEGEESHPPEYRRVCLINPLTGKVSVYGYVSVRDLMNLDRSSGNVTSIESLRLLAVCDGSSQVELNLNINERKNGNNE